MVTVTEAAAQLGVSANTLKEAGREGEIPMTRIRTCYLLPAAWLASVTCWPPEEGEVA
jgi:excisionase family DNA binding protein